MAKIDINIKFGSNKFREFEKSARYKLAYGGRGGAKSYTIALLLILKAIKEPVRILCTREIQKSIKDSVHKLLSDLIHKYKFEPYFDIKRDSIDGINGSEFIFKGLRTNINEVKSTEAIDICWVEEAQGVSMESLKILDPTIRKQGSEIWFSFNRFGDNDPVWERYVKNPRPNTIIVKLNYYDNIFCPNTLKEQAEHDKKIDISLYNHVWEGEPLAQVKNAVISRDAIINAMSRQNVDDTGPINVGVDLARFGDDKTVFFKKKGFKVLDYKIYTKLDEVEIENKLIDFLKYDKEIFTKIDLGYMPGVFDHLKHKGYNVLGINNGGEAKDKDRYANTISEMWFEFAEIIDKVSLPYNDKLKEQLTDRKYGYDKKERKVIESKDQYKKRNYESPDEADSLLLAYYRIQNKKVNMFIA